MGNFKNENTTEKQQHTRQRPTPRPTPTHTKAYKLCAVPEPRKSSNTKENACGDLWQGNGDLWQGNGISKMSERSETNMPTCQRKQKGQTPEPRRSGSTAHAFLPACSPRASDRPFPSGPCPPTARGGLLAHEERHTAGKEDTQPQSEPPEISLLPRLPPPAQDVRARERRGVQQAASSEGAGFTAGTPEPWLWPVGGWRADQP